MSKKVNPKEISFPHSMFPFLIVHQDGQDIKKCFFQFQDHADKYVERNKFKSSDYQLFIKPGTNVETVGKSTRRKSTQKRSNSRSSSNS
jgi:hypothetical protein